jgi:hypothetical protein
MIIEELKTYCRYICETCCHCKKNEIRPEEELLSKYINKINNFEQLDEVMIKNIHNIHNMSDANKMKIILFL